MQRTKSKEQTALYIDRYGHIRYTFRQPYNFGRVDCAIDLLCWTGVESWYLGTVTCKTTLTSGPCYLSKSAWSGPLWPTSSPELHWTERHTRTSQQRCPASRTASKLPSTVTQPLATACCCVSAEPERAKWCRVRRCRRNRRLHGRAAQEVGVIRCGPTLGSPKMGQPDPSLLSQWLLCVERCARKWNNPGALFSQML